MFLQIGSTNCSKIGSVEKKRKLQGQKIMARNKVQELFFIANENLEEKMYRLNKILNIWKIVHSNKKIS